MKRYNQLTKAELNTLTEEDIKRFIEIEVAYAGIIPVECPKPVDVNKVSIEPTEEVFEVFGVIFKNSEDAIKVAGMEVFQLNYDYNGAGYNYKWLEPRDKDYSSTAGVKSQKYYKRHDIDSVKKELTENRRMKSRYDEQLSEYEKYSEKINEITKAVWDKYWNARSFYKEATSGFELYQKYVKLANEDKEIALSFIKEAFKDKEEVLTAILETIEANSQK